jgi:hypothetical protein
LCCGVLVSNETMPNNLLLPGTNNVNIASSTSATISTNKKRYSWALVAIMLFVGRAIRVITSWDAFHFLQSSSTPVAIFGFYSVLWASIFLCLLQRPWKGKKVSKKKFTRLILLSGISTLALVCWLHGLLLCGIFPVLFFDGIELPLVFFYSLIGSGESFRRHKMNGLVVVGFAYLLLFTSPFISSMLSGRPKSGEKSTLQVDSRLDDTSAPFTLSSLRSFATKSSSSQQKMVEQAWNEKKEEEEAPAAESLQQLYAEDSTSNQLSRAPKYDMTMHISPLGILLVMLCSILYAMYRHLSLKISSSLDGPKRVFAIQNGFAVLFLFPIGLLQYYYYYYYRWRWSSSSLLLLDTKMSSSDAAHHPPWSWLVVHSCSFALGWIVVPFYIQSFVSSKMGHLGSAALNFGSTLITLVILTLFTAPGWILISELVCGGLQLMGIHSLLSGRQIKTYDINSVLGGEL